MPKYMIGISLCKKPLRFCEGEERLPTSHRAGQLRGEDWGNQLPQPGLGLVVAYPSVTTRIRCLSRSVKLRNVDLLDGSKFKVYKKWGSEHSKKEDALDFL